MGTDTPFAEDSKDRDDVANEGQNDGGAHTDALSIGNQSVSRKVDGHSRTSTLGQSQDPLALCHTLNGVGPEAQSTFRLV